MKYRFSGIDCSDCCLKIENNLKKLEYIKYISLSFQTKTMIVEFKNDENVLISKNANESATEFTLEYNRLNGMK